MNTSKASYRIFSFGLILVLLASFSAPTLAAVCSMPDRDCHDNAMEKPGCCDSKPLAKQSSAHCDKPAEQDSSMERASSCNKCDCTLKQTPVNKIIALDQAKTTKAAAFIASVIHSLPLPVITHMKKPRDFSTLYTGSTPIYLMNRVLLN